MEWILYTLTVYTLSPLNPWHSVHTVSMGNINPCDNAYIYIKLFFVAHCIWVHGTLVVKSQIMSLSSENAPNTIYNLIRHDVYVMECNVGWLCWIWAWKNNVQSTRVVFLPPHYWIYHSIKLLIHSYNPAWITSGKASWLCSVWHSRNKVGIMSQ